MQVSKTSETNNHLLFIFSPQNGSDSDKTPSKSVFPFPCIWVFQFIAAGFIPFKVGNGDGDTAILTKNSYSKSFPNLKIHMFRATCCRSIKPVFLTNFYLSLDSQKVKYST